MSKCKTKIERHEEESRLMAAVDTFSGAMKLRLTEKMKEGKRGWDDPKYAYMILEDLEDDVHEYDDLSPLDKLVDIANRAMMLWQMRR